MAYQKLTDFIAFVKTHGFLHASHFHVIIGGSPGGELNSRDVMMLCESTNLPGMTIFTNELKVFGESRSIPYSVSYSELEMNFILDRDLKVKQYFEDWANEVFNRSTREVGYYSNFTRDMEMYITDKNGDTVHSLKLYECYPKTIGDLPLDYNSHDILRLPVTIQYKYWENMNAGNINNRRSTVFDLTSGTGLRATTGGLRSHLPALAGGAETGSLGRVGLSGSGLSAVGTNISNSIPRLSNASSVAAAASSLPMSISTSMRNLGEFTNNLGSGITSLGQSLNAFTAPVLAVSNAVGGIAATFNQLDSVFNALGIDPPFSSTTNKLNQISGNLAIISDARGIPGQIGSLGAVMVGAGGNFEQVSRTIEQIPESTRQFSESLSRLGNVFSRRGTELSNEAAQLQSDQENAQ